MSPIKPILAALVLLAWSAAAAAQGSGQPEPSPDAQGQQPAPAPNAPMDTAEMLRQMNAQGATGATISPQGRPRRRAPRFAPFGIGAGSGRGNAELEAMRPGMESPMAGPPAASSVGADGVTAGCNQELTDAQRAANRGEAQAMTDTLNRMAELAAQMSAMQARQNGVQVTMGAIPQVGASVTAAFERALNCTEQRQAAEATDRAIAAAPGTEVRWTSESRPNVSGSSTVIAVENAAADGSQCLTVTDVIIIDGAETRAPKRMCRIPPSTRYVRS